jgi:hypothetical protein
VQDLKIFVEESKTCEKTVQNIEKVAKILKLVIKSRENSRKRIQMVDNSEKSEQQERFYDSNFLCVSSKELPLIITN